MLLPARYARSAAINYSLYHALCVVIAEPKNRESTKAETIISLQLY